MKRLILPTVIFFLSFANSSTFAQIKIGNNPNTINSNSILELESTNKGLLIPRVVLNSLSSVSPLTGTVPAGMLIYSSGGAVLDGFYFWNGTSWLSVLTDGKAFINNGNSFGTTARLGTNDNQSLLIETNGNDRMKIDSLGNVGIGISTPQTLLHLHNPTTLTGSYPLIQLTTGFTHSTATDGFSIGLEKVSSAYNVQFKTMETGNIEFYGGSSEAMYIKSTGYVGIGNSASTPNSTLQVGGSMSVPIVTKTSTYTATASDYTILCNTGSMTVNLPQASTVTGRIYVIKKISSNSGTITIAPYSSETIDGQSTNTNIYSRWASLTIQSDGSNWFILSSFNIGGG
jgi:hypothetical protein